MMERALLMVVVVVARVVRGWGRRCGLRRRVGVVRIRLVVRRGDGVGRDLVGRLRSRTGVNGGVVSRRARGGGERCVVVGGGG